MGGGGGRRGEIADIAVPKECGRKKGIASNTRGLWSMVKSAWENKKKKKQRKLGVKSQRGDCEGDCPKRRKRLSPKRGGR